MSKPKDTEEAPPVVSVGWLKDRLANSSTSNIRVLDVTWYSAKDAHVDYLGKHIEGAVFFNIMEGVHNTQMYPRNLPDTSVFQKQARRCGVNTDAHVVVYDSTGQCGFFIGGRAWWMFRLFGHERISVLDGGFEAWEAGGGAISSQVPSVQEGNFVADYCQLLIRTHEQMVENLTSNEAQVCDTRATEKYNGTADNPKTGHYPSAVSCTMGSVLLDQSQRRIKNPEELKKVFEERGINLSKPVVGMCNSGISSCTGALSACLCGVKNYSVYLGGFTEWSMKAENGQIEQSPS